MLSSNPSPPPAADDARSWDSLIASAPNFAAAQDLIERALAAGVSFASLLKAQASR
jgi:hypothetical protein